MNEFFRFHCEICNWTKVTKTIAEAGLYELPARAVPGGLPVKGVLAKARLMAQRFRCPSCGRVVTPKATSMPPPPVKLVDEVDANKVLENSIEDREAKRLDKPHRPSDKVGIDPQGNIV